MRYLIRKRSVSTCCQTACALTLKGKRKNIETIGIKKNLIFFKKIKLAHKEVVKIGIIHCHLITKSKTHAPLRLLPLLMSFSENNH